MDVDCSNMPPSLSVQPRPSNVIEMNMLPGDIIVDLRYSKILCD